MIDIHSHILPCRGDNGFSSIGDTFSMVLSARSQGVTAMFATPPSEAFFREGENIFRRFHTMKRMLRSVFPGMEFYLGSEIMLSASNMKHIIQALERGELPTMGGRYVLVEFHEAVQKPTVSFCLSRLIRAGYLPILAHWECYVNLRDQLDYIRNLHQNGCLVQLNVFSPETCRDESSRNWIRVLLREKLADFLGTDCHKAWCRPSSIRQGLEWLIKTCEDPEYAEAITWKNANEQLIPKEEKSLC